MDADHVTAWSKGGATDIQIARCYVRHTIEQKEINNIISFNRH